MRSLLSRALLLGLCAAAVGCSDTLIPEPKVDPVPSHSLLGGLLASVLQRNAPLQQDVVAQASIGAAGGTIRIPQAGFTITFPAGAVQGAPVPIRVTALAGRSVAYRFEPHGLVFAREPVITQELGLTEALGQLLSLGQLGGAYFLDESNLANGTVPVLETRPAQLDLLRMRTSFSIQHFSGYAVSKTRRGGYISSTGNRVPTAQAPSAFGGQP